MKKILTNILIMLSLMIVPSLATTGHINGCTNTGEWNNCCTKSFTITPKAGYRIVDVIVNGISKGAITSYTFGDISSAQTLQVITEAIENLMYTVTFNANGGNGTMDSQTFTEGTAQNLSENTFTRTGYTFAGWNTKQDGTGDDYTNQASFTATENTTLYAKWTVSIGTPNAPAIKTGLTPVKWDSTANDGKGSWVTTTTDDTTWYNYEIASNEDGSEKAGVSTGEIAKWANAMTADGSLYVWIPRYTYKITSGYNSSGNSWNADEPSLRGSNKIEIKFSNGTDDSVGNTAGYLTHPAFNFSSYVGGDASVATNYNPALTDSDKLTGIWVAKYEASEGTTTSEVSVPTASTSVAKSIPGVSSWRGISVSNMFDYAYRTYRSADSHLMKNVEWGAVAYLTNAIGRIPFKNNSSSYITGNAGGSQEAEASSDTVPTYEWYTEQGVKASTTHNVYGIYDMSGGAWEYVAAYCTDVEDSSEYLGGDSNKTYAGNLYKAAHNTYNGESTAKYVDTYTDVENAKGEAYGLSKLGDAVYETSKMSSGSTSWDGDYSGAPRSYYPVFGRGGSYSDTSIAGVFYFRYYYGSNDNSGGFRPVLAIQSTP